MTVEPESELVRAGAWRALPLASLLIDPQGHLMDANDAFTRMTGFQRREVIGSDWRVVIRMEADPQRFVSMREALVAGRSFQGKLLHFKRSGEPFWCFVSVTPVRRAQGSISHFVSTHLDITREVELYRKSQADAATSEMLLGLAQQLGAAADRGAIAGTVARTLLDVGAEHSTVALVDAAGALWVAGHAGWGHLAAKVADYRVAASESPELATLMVERKPLLVRRESSPWARRLIDDFASTGFVAVPVVSGGALRGVLITAWSSTPPPDALPRNLVARLEGIAGLTATALDNIDLIDRIRRDAEEDALTGLATRAVSKQRLVEALLSQGPHERVGVIYGDVDRFKRVNDGLGHAGGDEVLRQIAARLRSVRRPEDIIGRPGGDEFLLVLPHLDRREEVHRFVSEIHERFEAPLLIDGQELYVTLSLGASVSDEADPAGDSAAATEAADMLIRKADAAMYRMKERRRHPEPSGSDLDLLNLEADLHHAVGNGEIVPYFQALHDPANGGLRGYEALARWRHPTRGILLPAAFIPLAEDDGLIHDVGMSVLGQAADFADRVQEDHPSGLRIQVNVSTVQLRRPGLAEDVARILDRHPCRRWELVIEITESALILDRPRVEDELRRVRELGVGIAIDDFGTGYSSLSQLQDLPVTELKIDKSFVHREGAVGSSLLSAIVALARGLGLQVVAEGVETRQQLETARRLGCDGVQGTLLAPPLPAEHVAASASIVTVAQPVTSRESS